MDRSVSILCNRCPTALDSPTSTHQQASCRPPDDGRARIADPDDHLADGARAAAAKSIKAAPATTPPAATTTTRAHTAPTPASSSVGARAAVLIDPNGRLPESAGVPTTAAAARRHRIGAAAPSDTRKARAAAYLGGRRYGVVGRAQDRDRLDRADDWMGGMLMPGTHTPHIQRKPSACPWATGWGSWWGGTCRS